MFVHHLINLGVRCWRFLTFSFFFFFSLALRSAASLVDSIKMKVVAKMERVGIKIENERRAIADLKIENLAAGVVMKTSYTEVSVKLQDIIITDMNPETIHPTVCAYF